MHICEVFYAYFHLLDGCLISLGFDQRKIDILCFVAWLDNISVTQLQCYKMIRMCASNDGTGAFDTGSSMNASNVDPAARRNSNFS